MTDDVSEFTTARLSIYIRCLAELEKQGVKTISSQEMADKFHLNSAQIRKDLAYFGDFGVRGIGYEVKALRSQLKQILGLNQKRNIGIIGAGNLGRALSAYKGFSKEGFEVVALFDNNKNKIGTVAKAGHKIYDIENLSEIAEDLDIEICIVTVPASSAQDVIDAVGESNVKAVLNFAPAQTKKPDGIIVKNVDMKIQLEGLAYELKNKFE